MRETMPNAQCPMPHAPCPMPHAPCPMPHAPFNNDCQFCGDGRR
ncbi:MAG: hypothetical protein V7L04_25185 [Nostoc sp.]